MERMERRQMERKKRERSTAMVEYVERKNEGEAGEPIPKTQAQALALRRKMQNTVQKPSWHPH